MSNQYRAHSKDIETQPLVHPLPVSVGIQLSLGKVDVDRMVLLLAWMMLSSAVIVFNKWLFASGGFPYPLALTSLHMTCCFLVFGSIRRLAPQWVRLAIMPDADVVTPWGVYIKNFLSISFFYAGTLGTGQMAYLFSSVPFVQMMKPMNCIFASIAAFIVGMETPTSSHIIIVGVIACGIFIASHHATQFSMAGCLLQIASSLTEGFRLALVQYVTTRGMKLDPISTVFHFSFASAVLLACASYAVEWPLDLSKLVSPWCLVINCGMAVVLNILVATVIKKTSAVVFTLAGVFKDLGVVVASSVVFLDPITSMMACGYSISLSGLCMYKSYKDNMDLFKERGFVGGMQEVLRSTVKKREYIQL